MIDTGQHALSESRSLAYGGCKWQVLCGRCDVLSGPLLVTNLHSLAVSGGRCKLQRAFLKR